MSGELEIRFFSSFFIDHFSDIYPMKSSAIQRLLLPLFCSLSLNASSQVLIEFKENSSTVYYYSWADEFDSTKINSEKWMNSYPWGRHLRCNPEVNYYSDGEDLKLHDGFLLIQARKAPIKTRAIPYENDDFIISCKNKPDINNLMNFDYQSGLIYSKEKFKYGHFEIRFKTDASSGHWPAFWLFGADNQEIDIFEMGDGRLNEVHVDVHCKSGCKNYPGFLGLFKKNWGGYLKSNASWPDEFHTMAVTWEPEGVTWFLDDMPIAWWKGDFHEPLAIIANMAVADFEGSLGGKILPSTKFPAQMQVDYIRVWQESSKQKMKLKASPNFEKKEEQKAAKILKKNRPMYKRSKIKEDFERSYIYLSTDKNLSIQRSGTQLISRMLRILKDQQVVLERPLKFKSEIISLQALPAGIYDMQVGSGSQFTSIELELP